MQNLLDTARGVRSSVNSVAYDLYALARSFNYTGNSAMSEKLSAIASYLETDMERLDRAVADNLDDYMAQTFENSNNILRAAIAGIEVGAKQ